jgi:F-type H+-transporting ATPase subunit a
MDISTDQRILVDIFGLPINATIAYTWAVMAVLVAISVIVTWRLRPDVPASRWRTALEVIVTGIAGQITEITRRPALPLIPFVGTLFLFIAGSNLLLVVPGFDPPTASLSTTTALALAVLFAAPIFGVGARGVRGYLRGYLQPTPMMLPFNIIGEASRTLALAIRLYGNIMSGAVIAAILLSVAPFFFPVVMDALGLLTGLIQAYIFAILATVYIASATAKTPEKDK